MKIKELPENERPREKLIKIGVENISDEELIAIILKTGTKGVSVKELAKTILDRIININNLDGIGINTFKDIKGLGKVKTIELIATIELGKRIFLLQQKNEKIKYMSPEIIYNDNRYLFQNKKQECFYCLYLDNKNCLLERKLLFMGTINRSVVHPREVFKEAYLLSASKFVCLHNHPSGDLKPSKEDLEFTRALRNIGKIQGIELMDHLIITNNGYYSFYDNTDIFV